MQKNINFIGSKTVQRVKLIRLFKSVMYFFLCLFGLTLVAYCVSLPLMVSAKLQNNKANNRIEQIKSEIDKNKQLESMLQTTKARSSLAGKIIGDSKNSIVRYLDMVMFLSENGYRLKSNLNIAENQSDVEIEGTVADVTALSNVDVFMEDLILKEYISSYNVDTVQRKGDGSYQVSIILNKKI